MQSPEPIEMTASSQLIAKIESAEIATIKQMAYWSGLHENTVRDYRDGRIKHFGAESRFWNGVLAGLVARAGHTGELPPIAFEIAGLALHNIPIAIVNLFNLDQVSERTVGGMCRTVGTLCRNIGDVAESVGIIYDDGSVDRRDDPTISELTTKIDMTVARLLRLKARISIDRQSAAQGGPHS